ncbi:alpha/beta fold hydrolase [Streptomyces sp. NBC_01465]|uniref:alpha/beta fold hydrolase n=1 Tax=Streptomyces sp. NBC_01465 TaxID=2903878 RepID=UPI002E33419F|nr:alpha/beta hydrolase [Streptomyces sp. NBC_01465]
MPYFETTTDNTRLHYVDYGPSTGRTILFINSAYFGTEMWERQMLPLATDGYRCVGLDRRGHGRSDDVWGGFDLDTLAGDIAALVDHLDLTGITLVGHSIGTAEAVRYLTRHGSEGRVDRIALVAGMTPGPARSADHPEGVDPALLQAGGDAFRRDRMAFFDDSLEGFFALQFPENQLSPGYARYMVDKCAAATARAGNAIFDILVTMNVAPEMTKIAVPALVIHGTDDASAPIDLTGRRSAALIPDAAFKVYEHGGHGLMTTHADQLTADLREFMTA